MKAQFVAWSFVIALLVAQAPNASAAPNPISAICVEAETGLVLFQQSADIPRPPASMVKLMMMLLVSEGVQAGSWTLQTPVTVSAYAASMGGTQVFLKPGETWTLGRMMDAVAVASANDGAVAVAETLWGSEALYLAAANRRALELGMIDTVYRSANGLPPSNGRDFDMTTARDMAILARAAVQHPLVMQWTGQKQVQFRPGEAVKANTNKLLERMPDCDGLKTGFIRAAGFCIAATAQRNGVRLITIVMGNPDKWARFNQAQELLEQGFGNVQRVQLVARGQRLGNPVPVNNCATSQVQLAAAEDLWVTLRASDMPNVKVLAEHPGKLLTPIAAGSVVGELRVQLGEATLARCPLTVPVNLTAKAGPLSLAQSAPPQKPQRKLSAAEPRFASDPGTTEAPPKRRMRRN